MYIEITVIVTAVVLWFAHGWYLNERLKLVHNKLDKVFECFVGLQEYLYEIDPQFDDERDSNKSFEESLDEDSNDLFAGMRDMELIMQKEKDGKRTLNTSIFR